MRLWRTVSDPLVKHFPSLEIWQHASQGQPITSDFPAGAAVAPLPQTLWSTRCNSSTFKHSNSTELKPLLWGQTEKKRKKKAVLSGVTMDAHQQGAGFRRFYLCEVLASGRWRVTEQEEEEGTCNRVTQIDYARHKPHITAHILTKPPYLNATEPSINNMSS